VEDGIVSGLFGRADKIRVGRVLPRERSEEKRLMAEIVPLMVDGEGLVFLGFENGENATEWDFNGTWVAGRENLEAPAECSPPCLLEVAEGGAGG